MYPLSAKSVKAPSTLAFIIASLVQIMPLISRLNICAVAFGLLHPALTSFTHAQTERDGYRQVNTLLSHAFMDIIRDGQYHAICKYNAGFAFSDGVDGDEYCSKNVVDPDTCTRKWDNSEEPAGILAKIVTTGKFKWCILGSDLCPNNEESCVKNGYVGIAEEDNELQGIAKGDYYGSTIDKFNALTITMGKILQVPLKPKFVVIDDDEKDFFVELTKALASNKCYASDDYLFRHPYREAVLDFTCSTEGSEQGFAIHALPSSAVNPEEVYKGDGEGVTVCSPGKGTTQRALIRRDLPKAEIVEVQFTDYEAAFCRQDCDVIVDSVADISKIFTDSGCPDEPVTFAVAPPSSGGGFSASVTYRAPA